MRRILAFLLALAALTACALAAETIPVCYPTSVTRSEDGTELRKYYDLSPEEDPAGIPRSDFEQDGFRYTLVDLLEQELPEQASRPHTETVSLESPDKDMASVLALLPQEKEFITEDGFLGTLTLQLETVQVEPAGYESSTREVSATRTYPDLASQDTQYLPKSIQDNGRTLTLQGVTWQSTGGGRFTATATYTGTASSSYVTGYTVTADYTGTVSRIAQDRVRYVAIFEGTPLEPTPSIMEDTPGSGGFPWLYVAVPVLCMLLVGGGIGAALLFRRRREDGGDPV